MGVSSLKEEGNECTEITDVIDDYCENGFNFISTGFPALCSVALSKSKTSTFPPTLTELYRALAKPAKEAFYREAAATVWMPVLCYSYDPQSILACPSPLDDVVQTAMPTSLLPRLFYLSHYPKLAGHPGENGMSDTMRQELYWLHMTNVVYTKVGKCHDCAGESACFKKKRHLKRFPAKQDLGVYRHQYIESVAKKDDRESVHYFHH